MKGATGYCCAVVTKKGISKQLAEFVENTLTQNGRDWMHAQVYTNTSGQTIGSNYIAVTESSISIAGTETALTGEIATNGLSRVQATTRTHSAGTNSTTIETTFTATGSFTSVLSSALFNAPSGVTLSHIANFATGSGLMSSGDTLKVTWTLNLG